jgi:hypothetical protein
MAHCRSNACTRSAGTSDGSHTAHLWCVPAAHCCLVICRCCSCESHSLGEFFADDSITDVGFPDNKHNVLQVNFMALQRTRITVVFELLHGEYSE